MSIKSRSSKVNYQFDYQRGQSRAPYIIIVVLILIIIVFIVAGLFYWFNYIRPQYVIDEAVVQIDQSQSSATTTADQNAQNSDDYLIPLGINIPSDQQQQANPVDSWLSFSFMDKSTTTTTSTKKTTTTTATSSVATSSPLFQFKYPAFFKIKNNGNNLQLISDQATSTQILITVETSTKKLDAYLKDVDKIAATAWEGQPSMTVKSQGQGQIGKFSAVQRIEQLLAADLQKKATYVSLGNKIVMVSIISPAIDDTISNFYDVFLNTFKFKDNK
ncbi:MAG: hypothetical protein WC516_02695 [Patescibacteria group bacterium]